MPDIYLWKAHYSDGSTLNEYNEHGRGVGFRSIDHDRLVRFELIPQYPHLQPIIIDITTGMRLIFFRRRTSVMRMPDAVGMGGPTTTTVVGWQRTVGGNNIKAFMFILPDGSMALCDRDEGGE